MMILQYHNITKSQLNIVIILHANIILQYQPSGAGGTRSPPATPHRLPVGPKMAKGVWKENKEKNGVFSGHYVIASSLPSVFFAVPAARDR